MNFHITATRKAVQATLKLLHTAKKIRLYYYYYFIPSVYKMTMI